MSSYTSTQTFTATHAKHLASKVATDLKRMQRFYNYPSDYHIAVYETEIIELLKKGYLECVTYGFKRDNNWIEPTLRYTAKDLADSNLNDDDPGCIPINANIENASFGSYLIYSNAWQRLTEADRNSFEETLPFQRSGAEEPGKTGYFSQDKIYSSGGKSLNRSSLKNY